MMSRRKWNKRGIERREGGEMGDQDGKGNKANKQTDKTTAG